MGSVRLNNNSNVKFQKNTKQTSNVNFTSKPYTLEKVPKQDEIQLSTENKKKKTKKILIAIGAIGVAVATIVGIIRGNKNKTKILNSIPDDLKTVFGKIKDKNGDDFINEAYSQMVKHMGLEGIAPGKIGKTGSDGVMSITGGFNPIQNTIGYSEGFYTKVDKIKQLNMISHELKHCQQATDFLRTEGIGVEEYAKAWAETCVQSKIKDPLFRALTYEPAIKNGKGEDLLEQLRKNTYEQFKNELEQNYSEVLKLPKISADSDEGKRIYKLFEGCKNYEGLGMFGLGSENYRNNPLEVDAYAFGDKIEKFFGAFLGVTSK